MNNKSISETVHESISDLHEIGLVDDMTMRNFDAQCLPEVTRYTPAQIKKIRQANKLSQAVFAKYLNTSVETVKKWEAKGDAAKQPSGAALKLLSIVEQYGLSILDGTFYSKPDKKRKQLAHNAKNSDHAKTA